MFLNRDKASVATTTTNSSQIIIASMRLPVTVSKVNGKLNFHSSSGGLATGLSSVTNQKNTVWIGWPGIAAEELTDKEKKQVTEKLKKLHCVPVFLNERQIDKHYAGYCNATIWPLFHYFQQRAEFDKSYWEEYKNVNQIFADAIAENSSSNDAIWVHDYQLMLVPRLVRDSTPKSLIGFFLHTPFPSYEIFRLIPEREELLRGLLGADLVGFHTYDYVRHFSSSVLRILGIESSLGQISLLDEKRIVEIDSFPIGIDYKKFSENVRSRPVKAYIGKQTKIHKDNKIVLSVDRADYTKGIPERLDAIGAFLEQNPDLHEKINFIILSVPSRDNVEAYQELVQDIEQKVSHINGIYGSVNWMPISYINQNLEFAELLSLYHMADVMLVTPLRDGMNLVAKEFVAAKKRKPGVLILSELAGAASELLEVISINPHDAENTAKAIKTALEMPVREQRKRLKIMQKRISNFTVHKWASEFMSRLLVNPNVARQDEHNQSELKNNTAKNYKHAQSRLFLLDYDGTLKDFVDSPDEDLARPDDELLNLINSLANDKKNRIVIISGRKKNSLKRWFKDMPIKLVAEHGGWVRTLDKWHRKAQQDTSWKSQVLPVLDKYVERTPSSILEEKDFALVWHYREVAPELAYVRKEEIKNELETTLNQLGVSVYEGNKILEIKPPSMHKGAVAAQHYAEKDWDFVLAMGDDYTDEDIFHALPQEDYVTTINVGNGSTEAKHQVASVSEARNLLKNLVD